MSELYFKLHLRSYKSFDEELVALVRCVSGARFEVVHIMKNTMYFCYRTPVEVGHVFYSALMREPPTSKTRTVMSYWIFDRQEHYIGGYNDYPDDTATPNAELTPVTKEIADMIIEEGRLLLRLAEIKAALEGTD